MGTAFGSLGIGTVLAGVCFLGIRWANWGKMAVACAFLAGMMCAGGAVSGWIQMHGSSSVRPVTHEIDRLTTGNGTTNGGGSGGGGR